MTETVYDSAPDGGEGLLAVVVRSGYEFRPGVDSFTDPGAPLQLLAIRYGPGGGFPPHRHLTVPGRAAERTGEVLVVRRGVAALTVYTAAGAAAGVLTVRPGDVVLLCGGGHGLEAGPDGVEMIEVKQGPYPGRDRDKVELNPRA